MPAIEVFFDYTCPYCYRGHRLLMALLPEHPGAEIVWRPMEAHPRTEEPWYTPHADVAVQGALCVRALGGDELVYHEQVYRACFEERESVEDAGVLSGCAAVAGVDAGAFTEALRQGRYAQEQLAANAYAFGARKVWAVPTLVCGEMRLDAVENVGITKEQIEAFLRQCEV